LIERHLLGLTGLSDCGDHRFVKHVQGLRTAALQWTASAIQGVCSKIITESGNELAFVHQVEIVERNLRHGGRATSINHGCA